MMKLSEGAIERVRSLELFANCGKAHGLALPFEFARVADWEEAERSCGSDDWGDVCLSAANALTGFLAEKASRYYGGEWNRLAKQAHAFVRASVGSTIDAVAQGHGFSGLFIQQVEHDLVMALMEESYTFARPPVTFSRDVLQVYEVGHLPCGWEGDWPQGRIVLF